MKDVSIGIMGLGYVGLPLAIAFGKHLPTIGFDTNTSRIKELQEQIDITNEVSSSDFIEAKKLEFTDQIEKIKSCKIYIAAIPTPLDSHNNPDLTLLKACCESLGGIIKPGDTVFFESTVYPGTTEEICAKILENISPLRRPLPP